MQQLCQFRPEAIALSRVQHYRFDLYIVFEHLIRDVFGAPEVTMGGNLPVCGKALGGRSYVRSVAFRKAFARDFPNVSGFKHFWYIPFDADGVFEPSFDHHWVERFRRDDDIQIRFCLQR